MKQYIMHVLGSVSQELYFPDAHLTDIIEKSNGDNEKGELEDMLKINKSKMTAEERTAYDELIKKYAVETEEQTEYL